MQPSAAPFMTGAFNFGTMTLSMLRARSNLFESAGTILPPWRVDSMARGTISRCHLRTLAARTQSAVLRDNIFVSVFKMSSAFFVASSEPVSRTLLTSSKPPTRREDDKEGMLQHLFLRVTIHRAERYQFQEFQSSVTHWKFNLLAAHWQSQVLHLLAIHSSVSFATLGG